MQNNRIFVLQWMLLFCVINVYCISGKLMGSLKHLKSKTSEDEQSLAVKALIQRLVPRHAKYFSVSVNKSHFNMKGNLDSFEFESLGENGIQISGTSGVAAAAGFYHYLKYWCGCHVSWSGDQLHLPDILPKVEKAVRKDFLERFHYYQNVCTVSYSMAFWNWTRWEKEIDWMALNRVNLPLAFTGQETIWQMVYKKLGLTDEELGEHFGGPAFLAWQRMGNMEGWGGPLPSSWYKQELYLQQNILKRMRSFGMIPVLPGFAGHVPKPLINRLYPHVKFYKLSDWGHFSEKYGRTYLLDPQDPLFQKIGRMFMQAQQEIYNGTDHIYNADVFNEMQPSKLTTEFMTKTSQAVYQAMKSVDSKAVWLMQAWMFIQKYWTEDLMKAWFNAIPYGRLILLEVGSDFSPIYSRTQGFYGHPFIWSMIENFGGCTRLFGQLGKVSNEILKARVKYHKNLVGIGMTPEGINQNDINFEMLNEMGWRNKPLNLTEWGIDYVSRRYGGINAEIKEAWVSLVNTVYNCQPRVQNGGTTAGRPVVMRPTIMTKIHPAIWYETKAMRTSWKNMVVGSTTFQKSETFRHDLVKLGTQVLEDISVVIYQRMLDAYHNKSIVDFNQYASAMIDLIRDMDLLLSTEPYSLLGSWIESARQLGGNSQDKTLLEYNARNQITLWGPKGNVLDYANKNWGGLIGSYYLERWVLFSKFIQDDLSEGKPFNDVRLNQLLFTLGDAWTKDQSKFPTVPEGDAYKISALLVEKYGNFIRADESYAEKIWNKAKIQTNRDMKEENLHFLRARMS